jgi:hypothetical protein
MDAECVAHGTSTRIEASQTRVLNSLLSSPRVQRLVEQDAIDGAAAYAPLDFLGDVRHGKLDRDENGTAGL